MEITLVQGIYEPSEAVDLIAKLIGEKIRFQESKISKSSNEEDIKMRESRIKSLQSDLALARKNIHELGERVSIKSVITIN